MTAAAQVCVAQIKWRRKVNASTRGIYLPKIVDRAFCPERSVTLLLGIVLVDREGLIWKNMR